MDDFYADDQIYIDWGTWAPISHARRLLIRAQLKVEVCPQHQLFHRLEELVVFAGDDASDDVLATIPANQDIAYLIHPTFAKTAEANCLFPMTVTFRLLQSLFRFGQVWPTLSAGADFAERNRLQPSSRQRLATGYRRSNQNAFCVRRAPGADWKRLYSLR
jgi:hypothetical protein